MAGPVPVIRALAPGRAAKSSGPPHNTLPSVRPTHGWARGGRDEASKLGPRLYARRRDRVAVSKLRHRCANWDIAGTWHSAVSHNALTTIGLLFHCGTIPCRFAAILRRTPKEGSRTSP